MDADLLERIKKLKKDNQENKEVIKRLHQSLDEERRSLLTPERIEEIEKSNP